MANYKVPRRVELVDELPVNATGKVVKDELRARVGRDAVSGACCTTALERAAGRATATASRCCVDDDAVVLRRPRPAEHRVRPAPRRPRASARATGWR